MSHDLTPEAAVERLIDLYTQAPGSLKACLERYFDTRVPPSEEERRSFNYPELRVEYRGGGIQPRIARAYAKFQGPGVYATTVTPPEHFRRYLIEQLRYLVKDYGAVLSVEKSEQ